MCNSTQTSDRQYALAEMIYKNQVELLHNLTQVDLKLFFGYLTLQLVAGGWIASHQDMFRHPDVRQGMVVINCVLSSIALFFIIAGRLRRAEVIKTVIRCKQVLGFYTHIMDGDPGEELENSKLRSWVWGIAFCLGIIFSFVGFILVLYI